MQIWVSKNATELALKYNFKASVEICINGQTSVAISPPKPQFLSENFEIFTVGRLFYSRFSACFQILKVLILRVPNRCSKFSEIAKKQGIKFFFQRIFLVATNAKKNPNTIFRNQNLIRIRFLE